MKKVVVTAALLVAAFAMQAQSVERKVARAEPKPSKAEMERYEQRRSQNSYNSNSNKGHNNAQGAGGIYNSKTNTTKVYNDRTKQWDVKPGR